MSGVRLLMMVEQLRRPASGGIGTYIRGLIQGLDELEPSERPDLTLVASRPTSAHGRPDPLAGLGCTVRAYPLPGPLLTRAWDRGVLRGSRGFDVVQATSLSTLEPGRVALVTTVHDLLWRRVPEAYPARGRTWHEAALRRALRRSDRFIVPAEVVAADLIEAGAPADAVHIIPMGSDHLPPPDVGAATRLLSTMGVDGPFLLSVGTLEPRKNLPRLVDAYEQARGSLPEPWPLVLVGPSGWGARIKPATGVVLTGMVTPSVLSALYAMARLLVYVPLEEGFGLPPVEAMALGTPVVASPLPSTAGAAFEVDPLDTESIAAGLLSVAGDEGEREGLRRRGRERSDELRWSGIARQHLGVWERARRPTGGRRHG